MGKYSRQLSARLRNGYDYELFRKVTQDDIFPVTKVLTESGYDPELVKFFDYFKNKEHWSNGTYYAILDKDCDSEFLVGSDLFGHHVWYLRVGRIDSIFQTQGVPIHDWSVLQGIKNEIVGPEFEAVELYPAQSRLMNRECCYHLWILASDTGETKPPRFPIGYAYENSTRALIRKTAFDQMSLRKRKEISENCTLYLIPESVIQVAEKEFPGSGCMQAVYRYIEANPEIVCALETWSASER